MLNCYGHITVIRLWHMERAAVRELECFVATADHLNFSKAARLLNLSQPPLTRHIQALEAKLGAKLFNRNTHAVSLTTAGVLFLEDARSILHQLDRAAEAVRRVSRGETTRLRLAFIGALLDEKLVQLLQRFRMANPNCQVQITDLAPAAQLAAITAGELDGGFIGAKPPANVKGFDFIVWAREPLMLAVPATHELSKVRTLSWAHLRNLNWIMVSRLAAPAFRQQFSELERQYRLLARIVQESDRVPAILTMVAAGNGVTMVPQSVAHLIASGVKFLKLPEPEPSLHHAFAFRTQQVPAPLAEFLKLLKATKTRPLA
jgi:DNA-binding transcriptional LysR family regulator